MFDMGSCPACRKLARVRGNVTPSNPNPSDTWPFDVAMSIPSSENEGCHEHRGPNQLDLCDCCRRQPWEGGAGTRDHICTVARVEGFRV